MNRKTFLKSLLGGIAALGAIRSVPALPITRELSLSNEERIRLAASELAERADKYILRCSLKVRYKLAELKIQNYINSAPTLAEKEKRMQDILPKLQLIYDDYRKKFADNEGNIAR